MVGVPPFWHVGTCFHQGAGVGLDVGDVGFFVGLNVGADGLVDGLAVGLPVGAQVSPTPVGLAVGPVLFRRTFGIKQIMITCGNRTHAPKLEALGMCADYHGRRC